ncbi:DUF3810 domain-containing protein [Mucilaginibacter polytrichastri]|uniref:DUF3810 domain-containing protein n=1 Tax=Mucilaginibacter polytrichastri TaxID=1302689 RepID=A0A1Q6A3E6_9SPHI|nr:DUF3810 domain-containing protein [Mucilaginibacter polytrichastri]OKS88528.1 hypothetical protein RG47T_3997 [Mucilaginibacter polytrichastri]SFT11823.1 Protein of unknown function [Mucilaginibacter polytrichastri]
MPQHTPYFKNKLLIAGGLLVFIILLGNLQSAPQFVDQFYSRGLYRAICVVLHLLLGWLPFSFGDVLYITVIGYLLYAVFHLLKLLFKKRFKPAGIYLLQLIIGFQVAIVLFYMCWGLNYFRPSAARRLSLQDTSYTLTDVEAITRMLVDSVNETRNALTTADLHQQNSAIYSTAVNAIDTLAGTSAHFKTFMPGVKPSLISPLLNYLSTSGYYNPFTGEAQINWQMPVFDRPFTACHEMSHQMGFGREDEANFVGYLAGIHSSNRLLKYSAYYEGTIEFLHYLYRRDTTAHHQLKAMLNASVKQDLKTDSAYWEGYAGQIGLISGRFYDSFLKANNQPAGLRTYNRMIRLTMAWYRKKERGQFNPVKL